MHEDRGQGWVHITPTSEQMAHVYKVPQRSVPSIPERALRDIMVEPDEAAAEARPFLTSDPSSSSRPHPTPMSASQSVEGSYVFPETNMSSQLAIPDRPWSSSSPEHMGHHSQPQNLQERFLELTQKVDEMQQNMSQLQERIETLESGRQAADELQQTIAQLQERDTILEGEQRQVEAVQGDRVDGFEYVADGGCNLPADMEAQSNNFS